MLSAHRAEFERAEPDPGYTGDVGACVAGTTSRAFRDSELQRINWYRRMAGVDVVAESADSTVAAQRAAIMMMAAGELTHEPSATWPCYSVSGADGASKSNLGLGNAGVAAVDAYVRDGGSGNERVGHRGWVLSPYVRAVGMGAAFGSSSANALHVLGDLTGSPDRLREVRGFVACPPPGYVPAAAVFRRWSFRLFGDFDSS
ncbi:MAG: CAP domain-containing protein, partial [Deltaproteobacteria bacterium]|nr:CAP domain-containing protein [Deltaproteobacteria bacterium]